jgi:hypothetical protein
MGISERQAAAMRRHQRDLLRAARENDAYARTLMVDGELTRETSLLAARHWRKLVRTLRESWRKRED